MGKTKIEWSEVTWNPVTGCDRTSPGCDNCYALTLAGRLKAMGSAKYQNDGDPATSGPGFALTLHPDSLADPLTWTKPRQVFVNSMSDLFHQDVPVEFIAQTFAIMSLAPAHTFQVLTKRSKRMMTVLNSPTFLPAVIEWRNRMWEQHSSRKSPKPPPAWSGWPLRNVWLGVSIESNKYTFRADHLRDTPATVRWISAEPLLGPLPSLALDNIDWLVVGGESGTGARPMHPDWVRDLRDRTTNRYCPHCEQIQPTRVGLRGKARCVSCDTSLGEPVALFFKQWGAHSNTPLTDQWQPGDGNILLPSGALCGRPDVVQADERPVAVVVRNVGKAHSGRKLDQQEWMQYPHQATEASTS